MSEKEEVAKKKPAAKKTSAKKTGAKKTSVKKTSAKKTSAKKTSATKTATKKPAAKKPAAKKTAPKEAAKPKTQPKAKVEVKVELKPEIKSEPGVAVLRESADGIVRTYMWWSAGAGLIPVPIVDALGISTSQMKMIADLCKLYGVEFSGELVKSFIASLLGSVAAVGLRRSFLTKMLRAIPVIGVTASVSLTFYAAATTYAVGNVFIHHFENGGNLFNFEVEKCKELYRGYFKKAAKESA